MTDFLDVLEDQLIDAARRRHRRRRIPVPRVEVVLTTAVLAAAVALVITLGGSSPALHNGRTPAGSSPALGASAIGTPMAVLDAGGGRVPAERLAHRLTQAGAGPVKVADDTSIPDLVDTDVMYAPGYGGAALAVSELIGTIPQALAALRVAPLDSHTARDAGSKAEVVVRLGRDNIVAPAATTDVSFKNGCPASARLLTPDDINGAVDSVLHAWPASDRAVIASVHQASDSDHGAEVVRACGEHIAAGTLVIELELTSREAAHRVLFVSCDGVDWRVWKRLAR